MESFIAQNPGVEAFGGPFRAFYLEIPPSWFPPEYGSWTLGEQVKEVLLGEEFISGTNMVFRKDLLESIGGFKGSLGMMGEQISYGEETRLQLDISERKIPVYFFPGMKVSHLVAGYKMRLGWLLTSAYASGRCSSETLKLERGLLSHLRGLSIGLAKMIVYPVAPGRGPLKRRAYYALTGISAEIGAMIEYLVSRRMHG